MSQIENFLTNEDGYPICCWHGTGTEFSRFLPLSHFTPHKSSAQKYSKSVRKTYEFSDKSDARIFDAVNEMKSILFHHKLPKHPEILIPAYLRISHPITSPSGHIPYCYTSGEIYAYLKKTQHPEFDKITSIGESDFIFQNPLEIPLKSVHQELLMDTLYPITSDEEVDRAHLIKQRLIHFWEDLGFDSFKYTLNDSTKVEAYVVFRPEQIYRLDHPEFNHPLKPITLENKLKLKNIKNQYLKNYKSYKITPHEEFNRVAAMDLWHRHIY